MRPSILRRPRRRALTAGLLVGLPVLVWATLGPAQEPSPWARQQPRYEDPAPPPPRPNDAYQPRYGSQGDAYRPPPRSDAYQGAPPPAYGQAPPNYAPPSQGYGQSYAGTPPQGYGQPYTPAPGSSGYDDPADRTYGQPPTYDPRYG